MLSHQETWCLAYNIQLVNNSFTMLSVQFDKLVATNMARCDAARHSSKTLGYQARSLPDTLVVTNVRQRAERAVRIASGY